ncbi:autotransporter outer membrane beta-barrel domain-containing protein [Variovorax sp. dw_954]|uniref:autotransporter outer membrane beta-barrel domain-containing protein n=1 Tax=Variovorax sp. dw_954 TaxID=2720078 RepID=UPI001BD5035A|nr:autotransporter outer membrane beta-barrel domain-containing protein [Variovorax sp. dw_954]
MHPPQTGAAELGDTQPVVQTVTGSTGMPGTDLDPGTHGAGGTGGTAPSLSYTMQGANSLTGGSSLVLGLSSSGGVGGVGVTRASSSGNGGDGGTGGDVGGAVFSGEPSIPATVSSGATNPPISLSSAGGMGGSAGVMGDSLGTPGKAGDGGAAGTVTFSIEDISHDQISSTQGWQGNTPGTAAVQLTTTGGAGGLPGNGAQSIGSADGAVGGNGGQGGNVNVTVWGASITSAGSGLVATSQGGAGSTGAQGTGGFGEGAGGKGGSGGAGGNVTLNFGGYGNTSVAVSATGAATPATGQNVSLDTSANPVAGTASFLAAAIMAQSLGGFGGAGGGGDGAKGVSGAGGAAGTAGNVTFSTGSAQIQTTGYSAPGVVLQAIGGPGGNGPAAGGAFSQHAGNGGNGGSGGTVSATLGDYPGGGLISTTGDDSGGVVAQSIGGGGGYGGSVSAGSYIAGVSIGGNGEKGGAGGIVTVTNGYAADATHKSALDGLVIRTAGQHSSALVAQSIGGGGGLGGSASLVNAGASAMTYTVGGNGGAGGDAGDPGMPWVSNANFGILSTSGDHAKGMMAQAVGGGGGDGGSAASMTVSGPLNVTVAVGGAGGASGNGGDVTSTNNGQVLTSGSDAYGVIAQSISNGGGNGGMSKADALQINGNTPAISIDISVGGKGGSGGSSGNATATNNSLIFTSGAGANGLVAQSIAGGGGNGGQSSAVNASFGKGMTAEVTVDVGGSGGAGGTADSATATNAAGALIWTVGDGARGMFAQSISGGGGSGGSGKQDTLFLVKTGAKGATYDISAGGDGGNGAAGGTVIATNDGNILTQGDSADAIFAQSVGGGGGLGGAASSHGAGGKNVKKLSIGGASKSQSSGGAVTVTNNGNVLTFGADSAGIYAQSIGGGGGKAGTPTSGINAVAVLGVQDFLSGSHAPADLQTYAGGAIAWQPNSWQGYTIDSLVSLSNAYAAANATGTQPPGGAPDASSNTVTSVLGGGNDQGNPAPYGDGGTVTVNNAARIATNGPLSAGVWAQSVGGGGGQGGTTDINDHDLTINPSFTGWVYTGGRGFNAGNGGTVNVNNTGLITTQGDASYGILAQSVAAGGGHSTVTNSAGSGTQGALTLYIGGTGDVNGNGGAVNVQHTNTTLQAALTTNGNDAVGILAQSVGGGGGTMVVMHPTSNTTVGTNPTNGAVTSLVIGSTDAGNLLPPANPQPCRDHIRVACGDGGAVTVVADYITTTGRNAHGIVGQSVGGSGGMVQGVTLGPANPFVQHAQVTGDAGAVNVTVNQQLSTAGDGAFGILAQSVGGGGILAGDFAAATSTYAAFAPEGHASIPITKERTGNGGNLTINVGSNATVLTTGANAHAIFAQSIGGGGGLVAFPDGLLMGSLGGTGNAGSINITNSGTVQAKGPGSSAIFANSEGQNGASGVNVVNTGTIWGNASAPAILLTGNGNTNGNGQVNNSGFIANTNGTAVQAQGAGAGAFAVVNNKAGAQLYGNVQLGGGGTLNNDGYWGTNQYSNAFVVNNNSTGTLNIFGANFNALSQSTLDGAFNSWGTIQTTVDFYNHAASQLAVTGMTQIFAGKVVLNPVTLAPNAQPILSGNPLAVLTDLPITDQGGSFGFSYQQAFDGINTNINTLSVIPSAKLASVTHDLPQNLQNLAASLDQGFVSSMSLGMAQTYAQLSTAPNEAQLGTMLTKLANQSSQAVGTSRLLASHAFVERMNSCPQFESDGTQLRERDCVWARGIGTDARRDSSDLGASYKQHSTITQLGGQKTFGDGWVAGGSISYDSSSLSGTDGAGSVSGQSWTLGAVVKRQLGDWLISGAVDAGRGSYTSQRNIQFGNINENASGNFDAEHIGVHSRIARQFAMTDWYLKPYIDLHATHVRSNGYTETGAGALDLQVSGASSTTYGAAPMLEIGNRVELPNGMTLHSYVAAGAAVYSNTAWESSMQFAGAAPGTNAFNVSSSVPNQRLKLNAGVNLISHRNLDVKLEYTGEFAKGFTSSTGSLKLSYLF